MYSVTSCSGLMNTSTDSASSLKSSGRLVYSAERMRAILVGVRNSVYATSHAIMFTSSLLVSATMMSASAAPAASSTVGYEALPATVRMSSRSCRSRSDVFVVIDDRDFVRLFAREVVRGGAADLARAQDDDFHRRRVPGSRTRPSATSCPCCSKFTSHPRVRAAAFDVEDHAFAEFAVPHARAEPHAGRRRLFGGAGSGPPPRAATPARAGAPLR